MRSAAIGQEILIRGDLRNGFITRLRCVTRGYIFFRRGGDLHVDPDVTGRGLFRVWSEAFCALACWHMRGKKLGNTIYLSFSLFLPLWRMEWSGALID
jgi:hypothetical protein